MVCSGNICRSPIAEQLLRARATGSGFSIQVGSAGTIAAEGEAMTGEAAQLSARYGGDPSGHTSRPLTAELVSAADLILTAARSHRAAVVSLVPRASRYTFTLNEFARLVRLQEAETPDEVMPLAELVPAVAAFRGFGLAQNPTDDDIEDPYRRSFDVYEAAAHDIDIAVGVVAERLIRLGAVENR
jgi:protein-tyrosine phosphatase